MIVRISFNEHKPENFGYLGNKENVFSANHYSPALGVGNTIAEHETTNPHHKGDNRELPQVNKRDREEL